MGEYEVHAESEEARLQRESERLLAELKAKLNELDRVRGKGGLVTPEQRRRSFRLIAGGGAVAAVGAVAWGMVRHPRVAAASVVSAAGLVAVPITLDPPPVPPAYPSAPIVIQWGDEEEQPTPSTGGDNDAQSPPLAEPAPEPEPAPPESTATPTPTLTPQHASESSPTKAPKLTATVTAEPTLEPTEPVELDVDVSNEVCLDAGLLGVDLGACVGGK
jgi:hypothetical protein